ncbi:hypothetical protein TrCOL_g8199 [Triparma columacea]|uniref:Uncharacterized protein n=1 Tax=Triparma columacea TaxID=722753 RepID=A0A9W7GCQ3_9STRA|nr:hypothetical protein TrCOL_g8199 [Triparma columacea]
MASYADLYGYNWNNSTHPMPPLMTPTRQGFVSLELCLYLLGMGITSLLLLCFYRRGSRGNHAHRHGQRIQCWVDLAFFSARFVLSALNLQRRQVPSFAVCQFNGVALHFVSTLQFSAITGLVWERFYRLRLLRNNDGGSVAKNSVAPHWRIFKYVVAPGLLLHASLPVLTSSEYGHYAPIFTNSMCFATGGEGVLKHDLFAVANTAYFSFCLLLVIFTSYKSLKITRDLLASSSTGSTKKAAVQAERRATWFAITVTALFLACWAINAIFFVLFPFGIGSSYWPPMFLSFLNLNVSMTSINPIVNLYFEPELQKQARGLLFGRRKRNARRIVGSTVTHTASTFQTKVSVIGSTRKQRHKGSRVSHWDGEVQGSRRDMEEEARLGDATSRGEIRERLFNHIDQGDSDETDEERDALQRGREIIVDAEPRMEPLEQSNGLVELESCTWGDEGRKTFKATVKVRASPIDVACFLHDFDSAYFSKAAENDMMVRDHFKVEQEEGEMGAMRSITTLSTYRIPTGRFRDRTVVSRQTCSRLDGKGDILYVVLPTTHSNAPEEDHRVRASNAMVFRIKAERISTRQMELGQNKAVGQQKTTIELYAQMDFKTHSVVMENEKMCKPMTVRAVSQVQRYFQNLRKLDELDVEDGTAMGTMLMDSMDAFMVGSKSRHAMGQLALTVMMEKNRALREFHGKYKAFAPMLMNILRNQLATPCKVDKPLADITEADGRRIGKTMSSLIIGNLTAAAAVDEFILTFPSMRELDERYSFFRPFLEVVARKKLATADLGLKFRVFLGTSFSLLDMGSDIFIITELFATGENIKARAILCMIVLNIILQLVVVFFQRRKRPKVMAKEMLLTILCLKPAQDAVRVIRGEQEFYENISPEIEMLITKLLETFTEAIPGAVVQATFIVGRISDSEAVSFTSLSSLAMSIMATSFAMQSLTYDLDVNPLNRREDPKTYGMIPDKNRILVLVLMMGISACTMASQIFNVILLRKMGFVVLVLYFVIPMLLLFARKLLRRGDFYLHDAPLLLIVLWHIMAKTTTDFTAWMEAIIPLGMGGAGFTGNLIFNQCATFVVAAVYLGGGSGGGLNGEVVWPFVVACNGILVIFFVSFFLSINRSHVSTFFSLETGADQAERIFYKRSEPDVKLSYTITHHESCYAHFRDDVKAYVQDNVLDWVEEKPLWWSDLFLANIPDDMLEGKANALRAKRALELGDKASRGRRNSMSLRMSLGIEEEEDEEDEDEDMEVGGGRKVGVVIEEEDEEGGMSG